MESLYALSNEDLMDKLGLEKPFQARIVKQFLLKGASSFSEMTSLPKAERERLDSKFHSTFSSHVTAKSEAPSAVKLAIKLHDGAVIECVRLSDGKDRHTACLSSQVGCAMGCAFCKTGTMGLVRNLSAGEIVEQFMHLQALGSRISHIVFMGMGEALSNFTPVMDAIEELHREDGLNISYRKMTISTCGFVPGIRKLSELSIPVRLAVSLVDAEDDVRSKLMRINRTYPLSVLKAELQRFQHRSDKRLTLEYCLLSGINTTNESAEALSAFTRGLDAVVNLIPWNPVEGLDFKTPSRRETDSFCKELRRLGVNYTLRMEKGSSIGGACGQLASESRKAKD